MILTGRRIMDAVESGDITISPFMSSFVNPNSYNYRIGSTVKFSKHRIQDPKEPSTWEKVEIPANGLVLQPKYLYLASTLESIGSSKYVTSLIGRSSLGRLGLYLQVSADLGQLGAIHRWTLELKVVQPLRIYPEMVIGQVSFWIPEGDIDIYIGKYANTNTPTPSLFHKD